jgi:hypothetical protein
VLVMVRQGAEQLPKFHQANRVTNQTEKGHGWARVGPNKSERESFFVLNHTSQNGHIASKIKVIHPSLRAN